MTDAELLEMVKGAQEENAKAAELGGSASLDECQAAYKRTWERDDESLVKADEADDNAREARRIVAAGIRAACWYEEKARQLRAGGT